MHLSCIKTETKMIFELKYHCLQHERSRSVGCRSASYIRLSSAIVILLRVCMLYVKKKQVGFRKRPVSSCYNRQPAQRAPCTVCGPPRSS